MKWKDKLIKHIITVLKDDTDWPRIGDDITKDKLIVHLAIFNEPYLSLLINGEKTIESRFSKNKVSPYEKVTQGDLIILKESGGAVVGLFKAGEVMYFHDLNKPKLKELEAAYGIPICSNYDNNFWVDRSDKKFATLIKVENVKKIKPFSIEKKDRTAWSIISNHKENKDKTIKKIIAICGRISSGKTTLAKSISDKYNVPIASFGAYIKNYCEKNGLPIDRQTLQDKGKDFMEKNPKVFLQSVIEFYKGESEIVILEGVRHREIIDKLIFLCDKSLIIFIDTDTKTTYQRYNDRVKESDTKKDYKNFLELENHPVEFEIEQLKLLADIIVDESANKKKELESLVSNFISSNGTS